MCMLCGCDYLEPIRGIGAKTAYKLVKEYDSMEDILEHLRKGKHAPPEDWPYEEARELFRKPNVIPSKDVKVRPCLSAGSETHSHKHDTLLSSSGRHPTSKASSSSSSRRTASRAYPSLAVVRSQLTSFLRN